MSQDPISEARKRLSHFFNEDYRRIEAYLDQFGSTLSMNHINHIRHLADDELKAYLPEDMTGDDPLYEMEVECPVCHKDHLFFKELRAKSLRVYQDVFTTPMYAASNGYRPVNYNLYAVTVCPKCLFASPDRKDFRCFSPFSKLWTPTQITPLALREMVDGMAERMTMIEGDEHAQELFRAPRTYAAGILSYRLALERSEIEDRNGIPLSTFKKGFYWLKIALLQKQQRQDDTIALEKAKQEFVECFRRSDFTSPVHEFQLLYVLGALELRMGDRKACRQYTAFLDQYRNDFAQNKRMDRENLTSLSQWIEKFQQMWDRRDDENLWELPRPPK